MTSESINNICIKDILFSKAIPNYKIPIATEGYRVFPCTDCGDKFLFISSYQDHINRKSLQIKYMCRYCGALKLYYNRCQLLSHIRSHVVKTATINMGDIIIEPLLETSNKPDKMNPTDRLIIGSESNDTLCIECQSNISDTKIVSKDRVKHYMQHSDKVYPCPVCLFTLPSSCGLIAHLRIHLKKPPYCCPECGLNLPQRITVYPYNHDCEGFRMMRVTSRVKCFFGSCFLFHPNNYKKHLKDTHLNKVFKCYCMLAGYNEANVRKHVAKCSLGNGTIITYYECQQCPGVVLNTNQIQKHLDIHISTEKIVQKFPCWTCGNIFSDVLNLLIHQAEKHSASDEIKSLIRSSSTWFTKECQTCHRKITVGFEESSDFQLKCPHCTISDVQTAKPHDQNVSGHIKCYVCNANVQESWLEIRKHFKKFHNMDFNNLKVCVQKLNHKNLLKRSSFKTLNSSISKPSINKLTKQVVHNRIDKTDNQNISKSLEKTHKCYFCEYHTKLKQNFESHLKAHREPCMAYQCMECGKCFAVKPSFSTHLLLEHDITDVDGYTIEKCCFNKDVLEKYHIGINTHDNEPLDKNQCNICREKFSDPELLEKHYRVHGMAFLIKNNQKSKNP
ncbi:zinc finger protein 687a-like [Leptidea sinapis]|uniref:zinc finger protein 687a-like n=1 Tax=Leptidea sinapis TaxID=189913 RepID=UPI0021343B27|nr:zinc finger protein 687a-like [Leptidea sinapis]